MVYYRRNLIPGGTYFFTVALQDRSADWLITYVHLLRAAFRKARNERPFIVNAVVILPDHLHSVWTLPQGDADYAQRWRVIKGSFSRALHKARIAHTRNGKGELDVWQRRYWEHTIRNEADLETHVNYIHHNPVKHGIVGRAADWPHSSFHRFVKLGVIDATWAGDSSVTAASFGE
jgi:REP-associated tyrosine transposase